jgi:hypothetical protein
MAGNNLTPEQLQKLQRDNNKLLMAGLFLILFAAWIIAIIYLITSGVASNIYEGFGLGTITGILGGIINNISQFFFRKGGTEIGKTD